MIDIAGFKARFPAFENIADPTIQVALDDAEMDLNAGCFPTQYLERATYTLAAHYLAVSLRVAAVGAGGGASDALGTLQSKTVDKVSASYATANVKGSGDVYWNSTPYGIQFQELVSRFCAGMVSVNGC